MALEMDWENTDKSIVIDDAYIRVSRVTTKVAPKVRIMISIYASEAAYDGGNGEPIDRKKYTLSDTVYTTTFLGGTGVNLFAKAYTYLKTLAEFATAIDV